MQSKTAKSLPLDGGGRVGVKNKNKSPTQFARQLRKNLTDAEQLLWRYLRLRQLGGHKFRRQQPIGLYIVDFVCFDKKVIIEVDGGQHAEKINHDQQRREWLGAQGFRVIRFWNHEVLTDPEAVLTMIMQALNPPVPSPVSGEGQGGDLPHTGGG